MSEQTDQRSAGPPSPRDLLRRLRLRALRGHRPYAIVLVGAIGLSVVLVSGPMQTWLEQRELVEQRTATLDALADENARLEQRVDELNDPGTIEAEAREEQGMVRPGEVPYVVVPPPVGDEQIAPDLTEGTAEDPAWWTRLWDALTDIVTTD